MSDPILLSSPDVGALEEEYIVRAVRSGWIAPLGPDVDAFESEMAERIGVEHAVALSSGTAALHIALVAWGIGPGDIVVTSTLTFAATANAIVYTGAEPYFVDCDPLTGNMDPGLLDEALTRLIAAGSNVAAVLPVDLFGEAVDYEAIMRVSSDHGVRVLADAAESLGSRYRSQPTGSFGDASVFSFNGNKVMTTSGGGMLMTRDPELASRVRYLSTQARQSAAHYEHTEIGYNYRLSNVLAALGRAQLVRLDEMIDRRRAVRSMYREVFLASGVALLADSPGSESNCWLTVAIVDAEQTGWAASELSAFLSAHRVESRPVWKPMHMQPVFESARSIINGSAQALFERGIALPSGSALTSEQLQRVCSLLADFLRARA